MCDNCFDSRRPEQAFGDYRTTSQPAIGSLDCEGDEVLGTSYLRAVLGAVGSYHREQTSDNSLSVSRSSARRAVSYFIPLMPCPTIPINVDRTAGVVRAPANGREFRFRFAIPKIIAPAHRRPTLAVGLETPSSSGQLFLRGAPAMVWRELRTSLLLNLCALNLRLLPAWIWRAARWTSGRCIYFIRGR